MRSGGLNDLPFDRLRCREAGPDIVDLHPEFLALTIYPASSFQIFELDVVEFAHDRRWGRDLRHRSVE